MGREARSIRDLEEVVSPTRIARQGQVVRPKLDRLQIEHGRAFRKGGRARIPKDWLFAPATPIYMAPSASPRPPVAERPDCAPASHRETGVTQTCRIDTAGESTPGSKVTAATGFAQSASNIRRPAPKASGHWAKGLVMAAGCAACGGDWVTVLNVSAGLSILKCPDSANRGGVLRSFCQYATP